MAWLPSLAARARRSLTVSIGVGVAAAMLACGALPAEGETGPLGSSAASSASDSVPFSLTNAATETGSSACGSARAGLPGRPARIAAGVGATESTGLGARFPIRLAVTVTDAEGNPVPGARVTFSAPARGPSGHFATRARGSRASSAKVSSDACGVAVAPAFTANNEQGGYIVTASVEHVGPAAFALVNAGTGQQL